MSLTAYERWSAANGADLEAVDGAGTRYRIHLASISDQQTDGAWTTFSVEFRAGTDFPAEQNSYDIVGAGIAEPVFVVPLARDAEGLRLEAVFTQDKEQA
ncbi:hypothetical protein [Leifsonia sp. PS1209]|uniref:DUF6916 family protein n=1 Tax=Leifsonia sp. PS1209 TaxID=2724914 RepID=UPI001442ACBE|nr:hypothetical protein [Leifsonia sp. PS1209]QJA00167.1 hypothetical protein HF024_17750 [Leifsonia sp. PS1209]